MDFTKLTSRIENIKNSVSPKFLQFCAVLEVVFYTTLPTIIYILWSTFDESMDFKDMIEKKMYIHGEFLLYSIALLSSAYTTVKVYTKNKTSLITICIIVVSVSYAIIIQTNEEGKTSVDTLFWASIVAFGAGLVYTWHAMSLKNKEQESFQERDKTASDKLEDQLKFE